MNCPKTDIYSHSYDAIDDFDYMIHQNSSYIWFLDGNVYSRSPFISNSCLEIRFSKISAKFWPIFDLLGQYRQRILWLVFFKILKVNRHVTECQHVYKVNCSDRKVCFLSNVLQGFLPKKTREKLKTSPRDSCSVTLWHCHVMWRSVQTRADVQFSYAAVYLSVFALQI